jgi:ATP-dependent Lon protease
MDALDKKLNEAYPGRVVRKDLLHRIKKGTNVPSFVLEFLLARYCASDDRDEIEAGIQAVFETLNKNYVRSDEGNRAQSLVQQKGKHKFIDKVHVSYKESEKRHWAEMENFGSRRIAIPEKFYRDNDRLLEGGIWAEVTVGHNDIEDDKYAFYIEDLRPIQLSRFDAAGFFAARSAFTTEEWLDALIRSMGLEPSKMTKRLKFHFIARMLCFVEANYNFVELGPRGTGKSYAFSEFSPYSTLISQASTSTLFYNNARHKVGLVGFWDTVAFDEVGRARIKDQETADIMKSYMASGRFSRGVEVVANASLAFVGNIDHSIDQVVNSNHFDLFLPLPKEFDLAIIDRFFTYLPGWEMPKNSSAYLTENYGFITDYLAEAFHYLAKQSRYDFVTSHVKLGKSVEGRDEMAIKRTVAAFLKIMHPSGDPSPEEMDEYVAYAVEGRRRVKEQLNKRKEDDEYANINLSYINSAGEEIVVWCPESKSAAATQTPKRQTLPGTAKLKTPAKSTEPVSAPLPAVQTAQAVELTEQHFTIHYGDIGNSYEALFGAYLKGTKVVSVEDTYIRLPHQIGNFIRFCELLVHEGTITQVDLVTAVDNQEQKVQVVSRFEELGDSLRDHGIDFNYMFSDTIHDREIKGDNGWIIKIGRGLDIYQPPENWNSIGANDLSLRPCLETKVDIFMEMQNESK